MTRPARPAAARSSPRRSRAALQEDLGRAGDITSAATIPADAQADGDVRRAQARRARRPAARRGRLPRGRSGDPLHGAAARRRPASPPAPSSPASRGRRARDPRRRARRAELPLPPLRHRHRDRRAGRARQAHQGAASSTRARRRPACAPSRNTRCAAAAACNHRFGLYDAILIKDNHIAVAGGVGEAIRARPRRRRPAASSSRSRSTALEQLAEALAAEPDVVMLDNMTLADMREAVRARRRPRGHRSVRQRHARDRRRHRRDRRRHISSGWITHSAPGPRPRARRRDRPVRQRENDEPGRCETNHGVGKPCAPPVGGRCSSVEVVPSLGRMTSAPHSYPQLKEISEARVQQARASALGAPSETRQLQPPFRRSCRRCGGRSSPSCFIERAQRGLT